MKADLAVIGAGPGGYAAAFRAADAGMHVTLIDADASPGGVCTFRGCIPSKALLHAAHVLEEAKHATAMGIGFAAPTIDLDALRAWKDDVVRKQTSGLSLLAKSRKVTFIQGRASFDSATVLRVATASGDQIVEARYVLIASGSRPSRIPVVSSDSPRVLDSTAALELPDVPSRLLVVGGGYIGLELGTAYAALGSRITIAELGDGLLPGADRDLVDIVARRVEALAEAVMLQTRVARVVDLGREVEVAFDGPQAPREPQRFDRVLVAAGRRPNSAIPGLDRTRVQVNAQGFIVVDGQRRTAEPSVFAIGDVAGEPMLAHKASYEARVAVEAISGAPSLYDPRAIPAVVFTDPELAWTGLTETAARAQNIAVEVARFPWEASGRASTLNRPDGLTKLVVEPGTTRVLGMGIVGVGAGELIAEGTLAVEMGAVASDLALTIHPHPTLSETSMEAAEVFLGTSVHLHKRPTAHAGSGNGAAGAAGARDGHG